MHWLLLSRSAEPLPPRVSAYTALVLSMKQMSLLRDRCVLSCCSIVATAANSICAIWLALSTQLARAEAEMMARAPHQCCVAASTRSYASAGPDSASWPSKQQITGASAGARSTTSRLGAAFSSSWMKEKGFRSWWLSANGSASL